MHSDAVMSAQQSETVHSAADFSKQKQQTQTVAHSNQKHNFVQCHQNLSVKSNEIKKLKSTAFKSCKYHKQLMTIAQTFAEEATDMLKLQYGGVSTNDNLEFADCLKSSGHELNDIGSHLLECAKLIKWKHFGNINRPKDKRKMQARNSPLHSDESRSSSQPTDQQQSLMTNSTKRKGIQCYLCNWKFPTKSILLEHFDKYHTVSMFKCSKCGKHFASKGNFYSHL